MSKQSEDSFQSLGGKARAEKLSSEERKAIAAKAAAARWGAVKTVLEDRIQIGKWSISCYHLEDDRRVISQRDFMEMIDMKEKGNDKGHRIAHLIEHPSLKQRNINDLIRDIRTPIKVLNSLNLPTYVYDADIVVDYCRALLKAREFGLLTTKQAMRYAQAAESLISSVAKVGIIALIDEATGFQGVRQRRALEKILDAYLRQEFAVWAKRFPDDFYKELYRLKGWKWTGRRVNPPSVVGKYTTDIVYQRLAPGIAEELQARNPSDDKGNRKVKHHQWLTEDVGHTALAQHLYALITLMKASRTWEGFYDLVQRSLPKKNEAYQFKLFDEND